MFKERLAKQVRDWCDKEYPRKIEIYHNKALPALINNRCQMNAIDNVMRGHAVAVVECVMINNSDATLHYINLDDQGRYFDSTLGWEYSGKDYRMIRIMRDFDGDWSSNHLQNEKERICLSALGRLKYKLHDPMDLL